ncbi:hypothetical protein Q8A67_009269 [Cirrhinus molitorella]|uniref:Transferrin-like domain-containing protein n=1 Tax=Cirrhinus molitorella TaxID=172907 RepID=A0AA88Q1H3_9TELE|nr:hypothetical protein Q8A67_009269 [Cirrhinus molitorella]
MFSDSTCELVELSKSTDSFIYLREDYYEAMHALRAGNTPDLPQYRKIEWCTVDHAEHQKCESLQIPGMECRRTSSVEECIKRIMCREADAIAVDAGHVYIAGKCGLVPVMVEQYDQRSCHGIQWGLAAVCAIPTIVQPLSTICSKTLGCTLYNFFSKGCIPGADPQSNMCALCKGSENWLLQEESKCKASSVEMYYVYDGAFRMFAEKNGDVAFIKDTIVGAYTDGNGPYWAESDDFELICPESPDKSVKHSEFLKCNLAKVPAHQNALISDKLFKSEGKRNLLFSDSTKCLQEITKPLEEFLTQTYIDMIEKTYATGHSEPVFPFVCGAGVNY